ncbi:heterokaryon incompatibility protein-domain-containing protein [Xylariaceae sp. FL1651]|nr:heterokaryon incompatibility protein-domain-containing protein [Xylariaceae sp. FL1651]
MSRWHRPSCNEPSIYIKQDYPYCRTCSSSCTSKDLASSLLSANVFGFLPPNEPSGRLNLWWPPSVPYTRLEKYGLSPSPDPENPELQPEPHGPPDTHKSPVYGETLGQDEFRLACLSAPEQDDYPVHLDLETYKHTSCPEFETVSYTWGGEDGDNTPSRPVFVGPYWDILLQTKNCWNMLRFIRPWRGIRMVWIDALCINQSNPKERGQQVAKMTQIYEECSRVIVYLGPDVASPLPGRFPRRRELEELAQYSSSPKEKYLGDIELTGHAMQALLRRRYFSRVWVIQELVTSKRAVMRIGDVEYSTDRATASRLKAVAHSEWNWNASAAPWLQYMTQKSIQVGDLYEVLAVTSKSRATDLRDRFFGILGLIHREHGGVSGWQSDYSLSVQHVFVGLLAHLVIKLQRTHLLLHACTLSALTTSPTWTPPWASDESWQSIFVTDDLDRDEMRDLVEEFLLKEYRNPANYNLFAPEYPQKGFPANKIWETWLDDIWSYRPWDQDVAVHSDSGALSIYLTHLCAIPSQPVMVGEVERGGWPGSRSGTLRTWRVFRIGGPKASIFLASHHCLDSTVIPERDHIFMLVSSSYALLVVGACRSLVFEITNDGGSDRYIESLCATINKSRILLDDAFTAYNTRSMRGLFPCATTGWDMLPAYYGLVKKDAGSCSSFENAFLSCIEARLKPRVVDGFFEWEITSGKDELDRYMSEIELWDVDNSLMCRGNWMSFKKVFLKTGPSQNYYYSLETMPLSLDKKIRLRIAVMRAEKAVRLFFAPLERIRHCMKNDLHEVERILQGDSCNDDSCFIGCPKFPEMEEGFGLDGSTYRVHIH